MHRGSFPFLLAVAACFCLQQPFAEAGIIQGFKKEVPSTEDLSSAFDHATRRLREEYASLAAEEEAGRTTHGTAEEVVEVTDATTARGPRDLEVDAATRKGGTEVSFMILMEEFAYSNGADDVADVKIGTKFAFSGKIATKAEEFGVASGTCTVTSSVKVELSYCTIYHRLDTDNAGGYGTVMLSGSTDEVGGRLLVTGTSGSLEDTQDGYAMIQFDPAGNPVIYVLLRLL